MNKKDEEEFHAFESKLDEVVNILNLMNSSDKNDQKHGTNMADKYQYLH